MILNENEPLNRKTPHKTRQSLVTLKSNKQSRRWAHLKRPKLEKNLVLLIRRYRMKLRTPKKCRQKMASFPKDLDRLKSKRQASFWTKRRGRQLLATLSLRLSPRSPLKQCRSNLLKNRRLTPITTSKSKSTSKFRGMSLGRSRLLTHCRPCNILLLQRFTLVTKERRKPKKPCYSSKTRQDQKVATFTGVSWTRVWQEGWKTIIWP